MRKRDKILGPAALAALHLLSAEPGKTAIPPSTEEHLLERFERDLRLPSIKEQGDEIEDIVDALTVADELLAVAGKKTRDDMQELIAKKRLEHPHETQARWLESILVDLDKHTSPSQQRRQHALIKELVQAQASFMKVVERSVDPEDGNLKLSEIASDFKFREEIRTVARRVQELLDFEQPAPLYPEHEVRAALLRWMLEYEFSAERQKAQQK